MALPKYDKEKGTAARNKGGLYVDLSGVLTPDEVRDWREQVRAEFNRIPVTNYLQKSKNGFYCCPLCKSGEKEDKTGAVKYYKDSNKAFCHACGNKELDGKPGDTMDYARIYYGLPDYNSMIEKAAEITGMTREQYTKDHPIAPQKAAGGTEQTQGDNMTTNTTDAPQKATEAAENAPDLPDYSAYYRECRERLDDPAAVSYLQARGISLDTAKKCKLGYDPLSDPANAPGAMGDDYRPHPAPRIIVRTLKSHYIGRRIDGIKEYAKLNSAGTSPGIFNSGATMKDPVVFITEGAFDALSIIEAGGSAIALNSTSNTGRLLEGIEKYRQEITAAFIICLDDDDAGRKATEELREGLEGLQIDFIVYDICCGENDANDALVKHPEQFREAIRQAREELTSATLPGLLTSDDVIKEFQEADDEIIEIPAFPGFSKTAKIKRHSTVVLAADTGGGKSSLAINFLNSLNPVYPCMYFNLEMDKLTVLRRLVAIQSGLEIDRIEGYRNDPQTAAAVNVYLKAITSRQPLQIIQDIYLLERIENIIKKSTAKRTAPTMVFIDHSLLVETKEHTAGRYDRFTVISERLRKIALRYNIVLFVLLQQNRAGKADDEERPKNSSLKESGSWENDATHICFLWYDPAVKRKKLLITKNRAGDQGEFILNYWRKTQTYQEAKEQAATVTSERAVNKPSKRDKAREKLQAAYNNAVIATGGNPTLRTMAEAADVTTATIKGWIKEYGGCTVNGEMIDPAGIDTEIEYTGFIKLTPADDGPEDPPKEQRITARF